MKPTRRIQKRVFQAPKECYFCKEKKTPWYKDIEVLRRYVTERGKILGRARTGICAMHQRRLSSSIKHARHLALLPFIASA